LLHPLEGSPGRFINETV